ncbi:GNAT family N-acetyltransferase, partial [Metabacillus niabensis]|uniref:GNAT family N-acetyltransferase n=1 Tax=Metabacillus niabensis TaxID=324854 RepID=UPI0039A30E93
IEPPYTERYVRWCERSGVSHSLLLDFNLSAIACYEKAGFIKEGLLRDSRKNGDEYWSLLEMSILENEWQKMNGSSV